MLTALSCVDFIALFVSDSWSIISRSGLLSTVNDASIRNYVLEGQKQKDPADRENDMGSLPHRPVRHVLIFESTSEVTERKTNIASQAREQVTVFSDDDPPDLRMHYRSSREKIQWLYTVLSYSRNNFVHTVPSEYVLHTCSTVVHNLDALKCITYCQADASFPRARGVPPDHKKRIRYSNSHTLLK